MSHSAKITLAPAHTIFQKTKTAILMEKGSSGQHNSKENYRSNCKWTKKWHCFRLPAHKIKLFMSIHAEKCNLILNVHPVVQ